MSTEASTRPEPGERYLLDGTLLVEVTVVAATEVEYRAVNDADAIELGWGKTSGGYEALSGIDDFMSRVEATDAPQDHGPLAAVLSDRTLAKVLSRPAHVPAIVLLDRSEAEERVLKASLAWHGVDTDDFDALRDTFWAMKDAITDYAKAVSS